MGFRRPGHSNDGIIRLRLHELAQLFNSMDPSPFPDRDLDASAEEFIVGWAQELPQTDVFKMVIHLATQPPADRVANVPAAIRNYFAGRAEHKRREFRQLMRRGRLSLGIGLTFLAVCVTIANALEAQDVFLFAGILTESFIIIGWVSLWRPMEIYLYDWWPVRAEWRLLKKLSQVEVMIEVG